MPLFPVSEAKQADLLRRMATYHVREEELIENFIRGSGAGGQKINKTSSCVQLIHPPTKVEVKCQTSRSQALNRFLARRLLVDEIARRVDGIRSEERKRIEKIRRQKRKRSRRAKEKMLGDKSKMSEKKRLRKITAKDY